MSTEDWNTIETILDHVLSLPEEQRLSYIKERCGSNTTLYNEVIEFIDAIRVSNQTHFLSDIKTENQALIDDFTKKKIERNFIGRRIGAFEIIEVIGTGGMASVFRAQRSDGSFDQQVAIKLIQQEFNSAQTIKRFQLERQILADLSHPNIARLYDGGITNDDHPYLIMEYIDGMPIDEYCNENRLSIAERLELFKDVCRAVEFAHSNLVIHRDLKAQNIYVTSTGLVKILDFGIAKLLNSKLSDDEVVVTQPGQQCWTPQYAAPEQVANGSITTATDVYALGVLLHKLLTDSYPLSLCDQKITEIRKNVLREQPVSPCEAIENATNPQKLAALRNTIYPRLKKILSGDIDAIVLKSIRKEPDQRYNTVTQLLEELDRYQCGLPLLAASDSLAYRTNKFLKRHKTGLGFTSVVIAMLVAFASLYTFQITKERNVARAEALKAKSVTSFLVNLFDASDPTQTKGDTLLSPNSLLEKGIQQANALKNQPEIQNQMLETIGRVYRRLGNYPQAHALFTQVLDNKRNNLEYDKVETASSLDHFGLLLIDEGNYKAAETNLRKALHIRQKLQPPAHPDIATTENVLAYALRKQGKYDAAEKLYRKSLAIRRTYYGNTHPLTVASLSSLGAVLHNKGDYKATEKLFREVLEERRKLLGSTHPDIAMSLNNLGALLMNLGSDKEARKFLNEALHMRQKIYGAEHPKVALTMNNLAMVERNIGHDTSAESLFNNALTMRQKMLGDSHVATALSKFGLGELMLKINRPDTALALFEQALHVFREKLPQNHSFTARTKMDIGMAAFELGHLRKANVALASGYEMIKKVHPDSTLERALAEQQYGMYYFKRKKYSKAKILLTKSIHTLQHIQNRRSPRQKDILAYLDKIDHQK